MLSMQGESWQVFTDESVDFEKSPVEAQDIRKITHQFKGIYTSNYEEIPEHVNM